MADHSAHGRSSTGGIADHIATYEGFLHGAAVLVLMSFFTLVALVAFSFGGTLHVLLGFAGLIAGATAVLIDVKTGGKRWFLSLGTLAVFGLLTAMNVS